MGQTKSIDLPEPGSRGTAATVPSKSRWWLWVLVLGVIALGGWYYRNSRNASSAADAAAPGAAGKGRGGFGAGSLIVPVVVSTAQRGDLRVYFNGLGTVTAFNTVTVRSRVDGQLSSIAFKEGQFVHEGDLLAQIDPRPFQVQLEQAQGQLAKTRRNGRMQRSILSVISCSLKKASSRSSSSIPRPHWLASLMAPLHRIKA